MVDGVIYRQHLGGDGGVGAREVEALDVLRKRVDSSHRASHIRPQLTSPFRMFPSLFRRPRRDTDRAAIYISDPRARELRPREVKHIPAPPSGIPLRARVSLQATLRS